METRFENRPNWREYQARLKRGKRSYRLLYPLRWAVYVLVVGTAFGIGLTLHFKESPAQDDDGTGAELVRPVRPQKAVAASSLKKQDIQAWLPPGSVINLEKKGFTVQVNRDFYKVDTSLDPSLQADLIKKVRGSKAELIGLVALDPDNGKVLAMVGNDVDNSSPNPCLDNSFPAASIFKIITAAAAIEECRLGSEAKMTWNGGKYTLYKSQLKNRVNRYTNTVTFRDSFAQSINPVFGKIGAQRLGRASLEKYGMAFGFNCDIDFEAPMAPSRLEITDEPYRLAEIACGFNRSTTLTPLHGALIAAAVLNGGQLHEPTMIEQITDGSGQTLYQGRAVVLGHAISPRASEQLKTFMARTVRAGTCRKAFRGIAGDCVLSRLIIGGKTGTIDNREHSRRIDWFVGFAGEKNGAKRIVVSVVVGHGEYIGTRAAEFARYAFKNYFKEYFASVVAKQRPDG